VTLGQASSFPGGADTYRGVKIELPDGQIPLPVHPIGNYQWWGGKGDVMNSRMVLKNPVAVPAGGAELSFDLAYDVEAEWDWLWVQASGDNGATWNTITNTNTSCTHVPEWIGGLYGFPEELCGAGIGGLTGYNAAFPAYERQTFDLAAFAGQNVTIRFWYMTDWGTTYSGPFVDNLAITAGATTLFSDDAEAGPGNWNYESAWQHIGSTKTFTQNYYLQYRNTSATGGYDRALGDSRWRYGPANSGLLVWYNNNAYTDNEIPGYLTDFPGFGPKGMMLVVDAHPEPYRDPALVAAGYPNEGGNVDHRSQMRDATFSLWPSVDFMMVPPYTVAPTAFEGRPAVTGFHDSMGYYPGAEYVTRGPAYPSTYKRWFTKQWDASTVVPAQQLYGIKAPGYDGLSSGSTDNEFRFQCSRVAGGFLGCYWFGPGTGLGYKGLWGNPSDVLGGEYGWHVEILTQEADKATVRIWNERRTILFDPNPAIAAVGDVVRFDFQVNDNWAPLSLFSCVPIDPAKLEYVTGSGTSGAVPLPMGCPAAAAQMASGEQSLESLAAPGPVVAVAWTQTLGLNANGGFSFQAKVLKRAGRAVVLPALLYNEGLPFRTVNSSVLQIQWPFTTWMPRVNR
jgi:hypothetical protein